MLVNLPARTGCFTRDDVNGMSETPIDKIASSRIIALCPQQWGLVAVVNHELGIPTKMKCLSISSDIAFNTQAKAAVVASLEASLQKLEYTPRQEQSTLHYESI